MKKVLLASAFIASLAAANFAAAEGAVEAKVVEGKLHVMQEGKEVQAPAGEHTVTVDGKEMKVMVKEDGSFEEVK